MGKLYCSMFVNVSSVAYNFDMHCIFQPAYCFFLLSLGLMILSGVEGHNLGY